MSPDPSTEPVLAARAILAQMLLATMPGVLIATAVGVLAGLGYPPPDLHVPVPWARLAVLVAAAVLAVLVTTGIGLLFLRPSTDAGELRTG